MTINRCLSLIWLIVTGATAAAASTPALAQLSVNYSEWLGFTAIVSTPEIATDTSGAIYLLTRSQQSSGFPSTVTKLSPDGKTIVWQNPLGFAAISFTVDPNGGAYVVPAYQQSDTTGYVAKLSPTGTGLAWQTPHRIPTPVSAGHCRRRARSRLPRQLFYFERVRLLDFHADSPQRIGQRD